MAQSSADDVRRAAQIETLLQQLATIPDPATRAQVEEFAQALLALYGDGLARMLEITAATPGAGDALIAAFADDELVGSLLLLHGLHPLDLETRVQRAVADARTYVERYGGTLELVSLTGNVARLRLQAGGPRCSVTARQLQDAVEEMLYAAAPDLDGVRVEGAATASGLITLSRATRRASASHPVG